MKNNFNDCIFDSIVEDTNKNGYHIFLTKKDLKEYATQVYVYNLKRSLPKDEKLLKVYHDCKNWFPVVGSALIKFKDKKAAVLYQISLNNSFKQPIRIHTVTFSIYPE